MIEMPSFLQPYCMGSVPRGAVVRQHQQQQKKDAAQNYSSHNPGCAAPTTTTTAWAGIQSAQSPSLPSTAAVPQLRMVQSNTSTSGQTNITDYRQQQQLPSHYALPQGQVVYLHGGGAAQMSALGQLPIFMGATSAAASINIMPASPPMLCPTMPISSPGGNPAVTYYVQAEQQLQPQQQQQLDITSSHSLHAGSSNASRSASVSALTSNFYLLHPASQQQQQQQPILLRPGSPFSSSGNASTQLSCITRPTQKVGQPNMAAFAGCPPFPFAACMPRLTSAQDFLQPANNCASPSTAITAWQPKPVPPSYCHHAGPPPCQHFSAPATAVEGKAEVRGDESALQQHGQQGRLHTTATADEVNSSEVLLASSDSLTLYSPVACSLKKRGGNALAKHRQTLHSADSVIHNNKEVSITSQLTESTQGLPYAEDPVGIDITKRQLIVNYLPQRLTDERFKELFRPYGELMEEESHIIYDFRHHKMVPVPSTHATGITTLSFDMDSPSSSVTPITTKMPSNADLASQNDTANIKDNTTAVTTRSMPRSKGYGFIYYKDGASTERAIKELNGKEVDGKRIKVRYAQQQRCLDTTRPVAEGKGSAMDGEVQIHSTVSESESEEGAFDIEIADIGSFSSNDE